MRQRGNILFLILLAVVLFAALAYAVTISMRGGGSDAGKEKAGLHAARILNEIAAIDAVVTRWTVGQGRDINTMDFYMPGMPTGNVAGCTDDSCNVFASAGGNANPQLPPEMILVSSGACSMEQFTDGQPSMLSVSVKGFGTNQTDLIMRWTCLQPAICAEINRKLGLLKQGDPEFVVNLGAWSVDHDYFRSSGGQHGIKNDLTADQLGKDDVRLVVQPTFCVNSSIGGSLYHVVYAR